MKTMGVRVPLLLVVVAVLCPFGEAFRGQLKGRQTEVIEQQLDPESFPHEKTAAVEESFHGRWLASLMNWFSPSQHEEAVEVVVDSVMDEEARAKIRGTDIVRRRLRGGGRGGGGRSGGRSSSSSRGGTSSSSSRGGGGSSQSSKSSGRSSTSRSTKSYTSSYKKTTYSYTSSSSYRSTYVGGSYGYGRGYGYGGCYYGCGGYYGYGSGLMLGYYMSPYYRNSNMYFYSGAARGPSWSSSDYCYKCNRMGGNGKAQAMDKVALQAIDSALDILYEAKWDTEKDPTGKTNPDHFKAMILDASTGFDKIKKYGQISKEWNAYTNKITTNALYKTAVCAAMTEDDTKEKACKLLTDAVACPLTSGCVWHVVGEQVYTTPVGAGRRRLEARTKATESSYPKATAENRNGLINALEYGREEVKDDDNTVMMIVTIICGIIGLCCIGFLLWWCCCKNDFCDCNDEEVYHEEHHHETVVTETVVEEVVVETHDQNSVTQNYNQNQNQNQNQAPPTSINISGAGSYQANGVFYQQGQENGRPKYVKQQDPNIGIIFDDGSWWLGDLRPSTCDLYRAFNDGMVPPSDQSQWTVVNGEETWYQGQYPAPQVQFNYGTGGGGGYGQQGAANYGNQGYNQNAGHTNDGTVIYS